MLIILSLEAHEGGKPFTAKAVSATDYDDSDEFNLFGSDDDEESEQKKHLRVYPNKNMEKKTSGRGLKEVMPTKSERFFRNFNTDIEKVKSVIKNETELIGLRRDKTAK